MLIKLHKYAQTIPAAREEPDANGGRGVQGGLGPGWLLAGTLVLGAWSADEAQADHAIDDNVNLWLNYIGDHPLRPDSPWILHLEAQVRRADAGADEQQLLLRPAVFYRITPKLDVGGGYVFVDTNPYGDFPARGEFPEHRVFQQIQYRESLFGVNWTQRVRLEQRFIGELGPGAAVNEVVNYRYENRVRYLLRGVLPLAWQEDRGKPWYLAISNEVFFNFGDNVAHNDFDQNRAFIGLGRNLGKTGRLEIGFMEQTLQQRNGRVMEHNHTPMIQFMSSAPLPFQ